MRGPFVVFDDPGETPAEIWAQLATSRRSIVELGLAREEELDGLDRGLAVVQAALGHKKLVTTSRYVGLVREQMDKRLQENAL